METRKGRRVLISASAIAMLDEYIRVQREKNASVPGFMSSRNVVVSDIIMKFIEGQKTKEPIAIAAGTPIY